MSHIIDAPPHAMFRVLIRWGRFVFEPHAAPSTAKPRDVGTSSSGGGKDGAGGGSAADSGGVETHTGTEYRIVWFRAIDGVAVGHTKWCSLTVLHNVVSVVDFQSAPAVIDIAAGYMANSATRVILLQLQQRQVDPSLDATMQTHHRSGPNHPPVIAATGAIDVGLFVGSPPRSYIVTLEASFFAIGKLHMNLIVKEPKIDEDGSVHQVDTNKLTGGGGGGSPISGGGGGGRKIKSLERLTVLVVDSLEPERTDGGMATKGVGVYGLARLLQDRATDDKRFPLPSGSNYQCKISFVSDPRTVAKPQLVRTVATNQLSDASVLSSTRAPPTAGGGGSGGFEGGVAMGKQLANIGDAVVDEDDGGSSPSSSHHHHHHRGSMRKKITFRTSLRMPHDGRVLWRSGIALTPCTKVKFALYRDSAKIASTAVMASQLTAENLPHDFCLPLRIASSSALHLGGGVDQALSMQINLTLSEHTLDTVSGEVIQNSLDAKQSNKSAGHVCMLPGTDLMVMLRGYEVQENPHHAAPFSRDSADRDDDDDMNDGEGRGGGGGGGGGPDDADAAERRFQEELQTFSRSQALVIPEDIQKSMPDSAFVTQSADTDVLKAENNRLVEENTQLRAALGEQEERVREQENYILTLLETQGITAIDDDE